MFERFVAPLPWARFRDALCLGALTVLTLSAADRIDKFDGGGLTGEITAMTAQNVTIKTRDKEEKVNVNEIEKISYDNEPAELRLARNAAVGGRYEDALKYLTGIKESTFEGTRVLQLKQDLQYYTALSTAQLALTGAAKLADADKLLAAFAKDNTGSYHVLESNELLGDVRVAVGDFAGAEAAYNELTKSSLEGFKVRGSVAKGYAMLKQDKAADALTVFEAAIKTGGSDPVTQKFVFLATLGKAACLTQSSKYDEAIKLCDGVIDQAPEDPQVYAKAFNVLGNTYRRQGKKKDALLSFLKVDVLYSTQAQEHAEALFNLANLWKDPDINQPARADEAKALLKERYANTSWGQQG